MASKHPITTLIDAAILKGDWHELERLSDLILESFREADGKLDPACEALGRRAGVEAPSRNSMRKFCKMLPFNDGKLRDEINSRWPAYRGENARNPNGRLSLASLARKRRISADKIKAYAGRYGVSYEAAADRLSELEREKRV